MTTNEHRVNRYWGDQAVPKSKAEFFNAVTTPAPTGDGTVATIRMYGPIDSWGGYWGISTKDVGTVLDGLPDTVTRIILRINSGGGEVFEAVSILNMFRAHRASVTAVVDGLAASAASFIAAGCDEVVMSPGTQMMIHSPWGIEVGNSRAMRKHADILDGLESSMVELYTAKAGEKDWASLLADDTWLTAAEAVELGLADRVSVIPDAGEAATVGTDDEITVITVDPDDDSDSVAQVVHLRGRAAAAALNILPSSPELGQPNRKEQLNMSASLAAGLRERLGVTDAAASDELLLAAVDEALAEQPSNTNPVLPAGTVLMDAAALAELRTAAQAGVTALAAQDTARRDGIVAKALTEGRITPASSGTWRAQLDSNEEGTTSLLNSLAANTIPVAEIGNAEEPTSEADSIYAKAWGTTEKTEA